MVPEVLRTPVGFSFFLALVHHYVIIRFIRLGQRQLRGMKTRSRGQDRAAVIGFESGRSAADE